jgi:CheY-like chemotaxis protein
MRPLIFLADDDALVRALVELRLGVDGYTVVSVEDGDIALQRLKAMSPSLIILDLQMPRMGGLAVLEVLAQDRRLDRTPIMMLTASADAGDVKSAAALGVTAYVLKPFEPDVLANRVRRILAAPKSVRRAPDAVRKALPGQPIAPAATSSAPTSASAPAPASSPSPSPSPSPLGAEPDSLELDI